MSGFNLTPDRVPDLEIKLILEFMRHYHLYAAEAPPRPGDTLDWLALMRHHGAPTRLLDFTFSFQIAAYFALEESQSKDPLVYAVNKSWLTTFLREWASRGGECLFKTLNRLSKFRDGAAFRELFLNQKVKFVYPVSPFRLNERLTVQKGIFLCAGNVSRPFEENLRALSGFDKNVIKIAISVERRNELLRKLDQAGLNRASLFPGLDGFAQSLRTRILLLSHLQDLEVTGSRTPDNIGAEILGQW